MPNTPSPLSGFAFVGEPLERADALREDADALARLWPGARILVLDQDGSAFTGDDDQPLALTGADIGGGPVPRSSSACAESRRGSRLKPPTSPSAHHAGLICARPRCCGRWPMRPPSAMPAACRTGTRAPASAAWRRRGVCPWWLRPLRAVFHRTLPRVDPAVIVAVENQGGCCWAGSRTGPRVVTGAGRLRRTRRDLRADRGARSP